MADFNPYNQQPSSAVPYQPASSLSPAQPSYSLPVTPSKEDSEDSSLATEQAKQDAQSMRPTTKILLLSSIVFVLTAGPVILLLVYIFIIHDATRNGLVIQTTADLQNLLTISQVLTTVVSRTVPVVISVYAYRLAARWLHASRHVGAEGKRPSPLQLGLLVSVLQGANILAWAKSQFFLAGLTKDSKRHTLTTPSILRQAIFVLGGLLLISNVVAGFDTWLHVSSSAIAIPLTSEYPDPDNAQFGRQVNETRCDWFKNLDIQRPYPDVAALCGLDTDTSGEWTWSLPEGLRTLSGSSNVNKVAVTDDNHAILVPPSVPQDIAYVASSLGVQTACASITRQCMYRDPGIWGTNVNPNIKCTGYPLANITSPFGTGYYPWGVVDTSTGNVSYSEHWRAVKSNPFSVAGLFTSQAYMDQTGQWEDPNTLSDWVGDTGFFSLGPVGGWQVMYCNVTVNEVQYSYSNSTSDAQYRTISATPASLRLATFLSVTLSFPDNHNNGYIRTHVPDAVDGTGLQSGNYADAFALELSRELLGLSASIYMPAGVSSIVTSTQTLGSRVKVVPLALYVLVTLLYSVITLIIMFTALATSSSTPYIHLAHFRITSPLAFVHHLFGPVESIRTWKEDGLGVFSTESEADRLVVGPVAIARGDTAFGITKLSG